MAQDDFYKLTEGDVNFTPARKAWQESQVDEDSRRWLEKDARYFLHQAMSTPCLDVLQNARGSKFQNLNGKEYLDFHGNNVHQVGFAHPLLVERLIEQLQNGLVFSTRRYTNPLAIQFAEKLASLLPSDLNRVLLTPNGSSAVGMAIKLARAVTGKYKVLSFWDSFHGASLDVISIGGESVFRDHMGPLMPGVERIPPPITYRGIFENNEAKCLEYLEYVLSKENGFGALIAETIRNTDVQVPSVTFWENVRNICTAHGILLILDEIPIALGRTGKMFAFEHYGIEPDILCIGKGLGGGIFPQAAIITRDAYNQFGDISLGHYTHEKSPLGSLAGLTTIEIIEKEGLLQKVWKDAEFLRSTLEDMQHRHSLIGDVRGIGMLWGVELVKNKSTKEKAVEEAENIMYKCLSKGLSFKVSAGNVLQLSPSLNIDREDLKKALKIVEESLSELQRS